MLPMLFLMPLRYRHYATLDCRYAAAAAATTIIFEMLILIYAFAIDATLRFRHAQARCVYDRCYALFTRVYAD